MKRLSIFVLLLALVLCLAGCSDPEDGVEVGNIGQYTRVFLSGDTYYSGITNENGDVIYFEEGQHEISWTPVDKGCGFVTDAEGNITIISSNGDVVATSKDGAFENVVSYGDGIVLVHKYTGTIAKAENSFAVIDCTKKSWETEMTPLPLGRPSEQPSPWVYAGEGIFYQERIADATYEWYLRVYDSDNGTVVESSRVPLHRLENVNPHMEEVAVYDSNLYFNLVSEYANYGSYTRELYKCDRYGTLERLRDTHDYYAMNGQIAVSYSNDLYLLIINPITNEATELLSYPTRVIDSVSLDGTTALVRLAGVDGAFYFIVVNEKGEVLTGPIKYTEYVKISDGMITYKNPDKMIVETEIDIYGRGVVSPTISTTFDPNPKEEPKEEETAATESVSRPEEYVGVWKAYLLSEDRKILSTYTLELNEDGSGNYKGRKIQWEYNAVRQWIECTLLETKTTFALQVLEAEGRIVLDTGDNTYYREGDFAVQEDDFVDSEKEEVVAEDE